LPLKIHRSQGWGSVEKVAKTSESPGISGLKKDVTLFDHQSAAVQKVVDQGGSLLLSHGTGSGKTLTAIAAFEKMRDMGQADRALVVTPASLRVNFIDNGIRKFTNGRASLIGNQEEVDKGLGRSLSDPDPGARYHVVSYEMFAKDPKKVLEATKADTVIYDELHRIRNDSGVTYETVKDARKLHKNFLGLTGSLMNNTPADLVPLVDAMTDGKHRLGSKQQFEKRFVKEDTKTGDKTIARPVVVRALLAPFVDHFETRDMQQADRMPKKIVEEIKVQMTPYQEELYRYTVSKMDPVTALKFRLGASKLKKKDINNIFSKIIQSRQVSNALHTIDLNMDLTESARRSPKVKKLLDDVEEHLKETPDGQVVVHSNLIKGGVDVLSQGLKDRKIPFGVFVGKGQPGISEEKRQQAVRNFNAGKDKVIVISAAGGEGLDLKNATMFSSLDGHFNPERVQQAEARAIRAGGLAHRAPEDRQVIVKRYQSVVPRSATQTIKDTMNLLSPAAFLNRLSDPSMPLFFNPFKREQSPDEWMSEIANSKDTLNAAFRHQLRKESAANDYVGAEDVIDELEDSLYKLATEQAFHEELEKIAEGGAAQRLPYQPYKFIKSDKHVMDRYWQKYGPQIEKMRDPTADELPNRAAQIDEQKHIDALRAYYREAAKGRGAPAKGVNTDSDVLKSHAKALALSAPLIGALSAPRTAMINMPEAQGFSSGLKHFGKHWAAWTAGAAALSIPFELWNLRQPYFTTQKTKARKAVKLSDEELRSMLRGMSVTEEQVKKTEHFIA
jgi:superfamily II DNA or RNA helicase